MRMGVLKNTRCWRNSSARAAAKELQGDTSRGAETFRKLYGDGAFHPAKVAMNN